MRKFKDFWPTTHLSGYMSVGAEEAEAPRVWTAGGEVMPWLSEPHLLKDGYVRIKAPSKEIFRGYYANLDSASIDAMVEDAETQFHLSEIDESCRDPLMQIVRTFPPLEQIEEWWDGISGAVSVTAVGRVLARANAERLDRKNFLPPLI